MFLLSGSSRSIKKKSDSFPGYCEEGVLTICPDYSDRPSPDFLALFLSHPQGWHVRESFRSALDLVPILGAENQATDN